MPCEMKLLPVPRLKALINRKNISGWQERGSTFTYQTTQLKIPILLHTEPRRYLIMACSVKETWITLQTSHSRFDICNRRTFIETGLSNNEIDIIIVQTTLT